MKVIQLERGQQGVKEPILDSNDQEIEFENAYLVNRHFQNFNEQKRNSYSSISNNAQSTPYSDMKYVNPSIVKNHIPKFNKSETNNIL